MTFLGNIRLGRDVSLSDLLTNYHAVLCTYGAAEDRALGILMCHNFKNGECVRLVKIYHW